jgi:ubiquinone/menaquinone biosynthesis C-methylase UbiE
MSKTPVKAWTYYWQKNRLHSCLANSPQDQHEIDNLWLQFVANTVNQKEQVSLLDLATGNGAVPQAIRKKFPDIDITAVDYAEIFPPKEHFSKLSAKAINFLGGINIESLPFNSYQFDIVTSQFGIEYSSINESFIQMLRVLKNSGVFQFLIHHHQSAIVTSSKKRLQELINIRSNEGLLVLLKDYILDMLSLSECQQKLEHLIARSQLRTAITEQFITAFELVYQHKIQQLPIEHSLKIYQQLAEGSQAEAERLAQLLAAAHSEEQIRHRVDFLSQHKCHCSYRPLLLSDHTIIGWIIEGKK